uniref:hypothetical protein n=1 Tax=Roseinatronobacter sp. TaxID=1945755 RepID=UPI0025E8C3DC
HERTAFRLGDYFSGLLGCDTLKAGRLVHKLIGFADVLGARTLSAELRKFEDLIRDDDIETITDGLERLDEAMTNTLAQVDHLVKEAGRETSD